MLKCCTSLVLALAAAVPAARAGEARELRIVKQPGLAYLPLVVMREMRLIEKHAPGVTVDWRQLTSGPVIRDAMIAGEIDIGSVQHILLQMEAERELGDPRKLDRQLVAMAQEDATAALLSHREITCHFSGPPYQYEQLRHPGIVKVFDSYKPMGGPHNFNLVWTSEEWAKANPKLLASFVEAMKEAMEFIAREPSEAAGIYARSEKSSSTAAQIADIIRQPGIRYTMTPKGMSRFASFMAKIGSIKSARPSWREYALPHLHELPGS